MILDIEDKAEVIAAYENKHNIPEVLRYTEYVEEHNCYQLKISIGAGFIQKRYEEALKQLQKEKNTDVVGVLEISMEHNMKDVSTYHIDNVDKMITDFFNSKRNEKQIGIQYQGMEPIYLFYLNCKTEYPIFLDLPFDGSLSTNQLCEIEKYRYKWFVGYIKLKEQSIIDETQHIISQATSNLSAKQPAFHYDKEIKRRMRQNKKIFINERMEDFDFRSIDLSGAIFINCVLCHANFAHVNMCDTLFINCDLQGAVYLGATLNNSFEIKGDQIPLIDIYKEYGRQK